MSIGYHSIPHDLTSIATGSVSFDNDPNRSSVVSCLVPASLAVVTR